MIGCGFHLLAWLETTSGEAGVATWASVDGLWQLPSDGLISDGDGGSYDGSARMVDVRGRGQRYIRALYFAIITMVSATRALRSSWYRLGERWPSLGPSLSPPLCTRHVGGAAWSTFVRPSLVAGHRRLRRHRPGDAAGDGVHDGCDLHWTAAEQLDDRLCWTRVL